MIISQALLYEDRSIKKIFRIFRVKITCCWLKRIYFDRWCKFLASEIDSSFCNTKSISVFLLKIGFTSVRLRHVKSVETEKGERERRGYIKVDEKGKSLEEWGTLYCRLRKKHHFFLENSRALPAQIDDRNSMNVCKF